MHKGAVAKAASHIDDALARGARLVAGSRPSGDTLLVAPTVLVDVSDEAMIMWEETFAPIAPVTFFDSETEVFRRSTFPHPCAIEDADVRNDTPTRLYSAGAKPSGFLLPRKTFGGTAIAQEG